MKAFPGWNGLIWFTTNAGKVGTYNPETNQIGIWTPPGGINLDLCPSVNCPTGIVKGIAVDATGTYVMTNSILVKFAAGHGNNNNTIDEGPGGTPKLVWSYPYDRGSAMYNCTAPGCGAEFGKPVCIYSFRTKQLSTVAVLRRRMYTCSKRQFDNNHNYAFGFPVRVLNYRFTDSISTFYLHVIRFIVSIVLDGDETRDAKLGIGDESKIVWWNERRRPCCHRQ